MCKEIHDKCLFVLLSEYDGGVGSWWGFRGTELSAVSKELSLLKDWHFWPVSFKDAITEKKRQREKRLAEEKTATSSENADTATNNMEEESTDSKS